MDAVARHFEALYRACDDPWNVRGAWYERRKRALLLASLGRAHYDHALEAGCGSGAMTLALASRCHRVTAVDLAATAIDRCRQLMQAGHMAGVETLALRLPDAWPAIPPGGFDLMVVSEMAYYLDDDALTRFLARTSASLRPGAELIACHWRGQFDDRRQQTDALHGAFAALPGARPLFSHQEPAFRLDAWTLHPAQGHPQ
ncbi:MULTISPECIES: SAM-dependent methyltransferase [Achromobacter]|uniref:SAM-dependent methyltransferase n=1 Tax=Achromobacter TaxID=222 RepID=UPI0006BF97BC|nr:MULTISPECIES: class I SAM-dependent methyltransferase [Achromobacter]CAB3845274.1 hypothetical protein LMG26846_01692 [Achromobacter insuavis]CUI35404.1 biotin biosynthesis protein BioC [Achromobacter sp. 2789STDY5608621]CUJ83017.1 biotin biosynthesis protein BioC [Achromobacter sp. 2789STDY5608615]